MAVVLENSGRVEPERIESYIAAGGYQALYHVLREMTPGGGRRGDHPQRPARPRRGRLPDRREVGHGRQEPRRAQVRRLQRRRGRPRRVHGPQRPGERPAPRPGRDGHRRLRGRGEPGLHLRPRRVSRWRSAAWRRPSSRPSGSACSAASIFESPFDFRIDIRIGAGAFVCGEETALMASIEGKRGTPRPRPPYPAEEGLWGCPTLINNVETFANVPPIIRNGRRLVRRHRHGEEQGDQGLRPGRQDQEHRPGRGADGHPAAARSSRRSAAARPTAARSRRCRPAARPAAASRPSTSTRRSTTSRWRSSARSWAPAA